MNLKHDMALFLIGRFEGCRRELFQTSRFTISVSSHGYITWSSMNVNRDTVNDFSLIDWGFWKQYSWHKINAWTVIVIRQ